MTGHRLLGDADPDFAFTESSGHGHEQLEAVALSRPLGPTGARNAKKLVYREGCAQNECERKTQSLRPGSPRLSEKSAHILSVSNQKFHCLITIACSECRTAPSRSCVVHCAHRTPSSILDSIVCL